MQKALPPPKWLIPQLLAQISAPLLPLPPVQGRLKRRLGPSIYMETQWMQSEWAPPLLHLLV